MDFKEVIRKIKSEYNIIDYIKSNGVDLESSSSSSYKGLCPFHNEKTPSFTVSEDFQNYRCFGCGESGDVISFAMKTHTISVGEAIKMLADEKGIELEIKAQDENSADISGIRKVMEDTAKFFRINYEKLPESHPAKQEVKKRTLDVNNPIFGYSLETPNSLYLHLKEKGHSDKNIEDSNMVIFFEDRKPWDFFHGRLMITLSDYLGRPVSFTSRKLFEDDKMQAKYVNGKESPVFSKKNNLFGADTAKKLARAKKMIYVVEGQFDKIAMEEKGISNVVATSGTAFTQEHANLLMRMIGESGKIIFIMDGDKAGIEAALKVFQSSNTLHMNSYAVLLKEGKDPCDYIVEKGIDYLLEEIEHAKPLHDFVIDSIVRNLGGSVNMSNRQNFVSEVATYAKFAKDGYIVDSMLNKSSIISAISIDSVREIYNKTDIKRTAKREVKKEENVRRLKPKINIDLLNEGDSCMFTALALLVRIPEKTIDVTPEEVHFKFKSFIEEVKKNYKQKVGKGKEWRFIEEEYEDVDFAKALKNKIFVFDPKEDENEAASQYVYLFNTANLIYKKEYNSMRRAKALSSVINVTDPKEIAEALKLYNEIEIFNLHNESKKESLEIYNETEALKLQDEKK